LSVVSAASDGREPETALTGAVLTATEVSETEDLIRWAAAATPASFASLAPVVLTVADAGDLRANSIVSLAVEELALHVRALARQLFTDERASVPVAFTGGLLTKRSALRKRLEHRLKSAVPGAQIHAEEIDPARGAVRGALRYLAELGV
jgi:glucosamine kinase